jgi:hypothetical protein
MATIDYFQKERKGLITFFPRAHTTNSVMFVDLIDLDLLTLTQFLQACQLFSFLQ